MNTSSDSPEAVSTAFGAVASSATPVPTLVPTEVAAAGVAAAGVEAEATVPAPTDGLDEARTPSGLSVVGGAFLSRRRLLGLAGLSAAAVPLAACSGSGGSGGSRVIRFGYVSPQTGALADFADADTYTTESMRAYFRRGLSVGRNTYPVEIVVRDSQSDRNRAAEAASDLIFKDKVDIVLVASTPETTNPVSDQCEANGVPCISTIAPWQSWLFGRGGSPSKPFQWTYHFFWGLEDIIQVYLDMWGQLETNHKVGVLWPNDSDGLAFADPNNGFPTQMRSRGYEIVQPDPPRYADGTRDYTSMVGQFKAAGVDIVTGVPQPPDFQAFWKAANDNSFFPKVVTMAKALLFEKSLKDLGLKANRLGTEVWWSPDHKFRSSLTRATPRDLATDYQAKTGSHWVQTLGFIHALYEVATEAIASVDSPDDRAGIARAIAGMSKYTIVGPISFRSRPDLPKNVAKTPLAGGQWILNGDNYDLTIISNPEQQRAIPQASGGMLPYVPPQT